MCAGVESRICVVFWLGWDGVGRCLLFGISIPTVASLAYDATFFRLLLCDRAAVLQWTGGSKNQLSISKLTGNSNRDQHPQVTNLVERFHRGPRSSYDDKQRAHPLKEGSAVFSRLGVKQQQYL